jgi:NADP-dependent 3-hydroxy acid dehydrogenase YdfG
MASHSLPVVVLTGASSGIGRATAHVLARRGARLVLAARDAAALEGVANECKELGSTAIVVPTDVTDARAVRDLAESALSQFGTMDVWINNVGVGAVGRYDLVPLESHRRVIESNLLGHMHGSHVALTHFRRRRRGTLINMISIGGWLSAPYAAAYTASKFALKGFGQSFSLRSSIRRGYAMGPITHAGHCALFRRCSIRKPWRKESRICCVTRDPSSLLEAPPGLVVQFETSHRRPVAVYCTGSWTSRSRGDSTRPKPTGISSSHPAVTRSSAGSGDLPRARCCSLQAPRQASLRSRG